MNGGILQTKVNFIKYTRVKDGAGGWENIDPIIVLTTFCSVKQIKASRTAENFQEGINSVYELRLRMRACFNPQSDYTVKFNGEEYNIVEIVEDLKNKSFWLITIVKRGKGV